MSYTNINELPSEVRNSLDETDSKVWMDAYNSQKPKTQEEIELAKKYAWEQCKELPSSFSFDIIASVEDVDSDGELITLDSIKNKMDKFIEQGGTSQDEHGNYHVATIWDYDDYTDPETGYPGILVHGNVFGGRGENEEYARARQDFIDGKNSLSIAGDASVEGYECDGARCFVRRNMTTLMEISLVENPANPYAKMLWYNDKAIVKSGVAKSQDDAPTDESLSTRFKVKSINVHKSYNECDLQKIVRLLKGYDCKVTSKGVVVDSSKYVGNPTAYVNLIKSKIKTLGQVVATSADSVTIDTNKRILEREFKKSYSNKECDEYGTLTKRVSKGRFYELFNRGLIAETPKGWGFEGSILNDKVVKARYTFKCDFSTATLGQPAKVNDGYELSVTGYSLKVKNETIAQNLQGTLFISDNDLNDSTEEDEIYQRLYDERVEEIERQFKREHSEDEDDYYILEEEMSQRQIQANKELDSEFENIQYELVSVGKLPSVSFKGSYDEYEGASLDDEYADELKIKLNVRLTIGGQPYDIEVESYFASFVPSDDAIVEMESYMESESAE